MSQKLETSFFPDLGEPKDSGIHKPERIVQEPELDSKHKQNTTKLQPQSVYVKDNDKALPVIHQIESLLQLIYRYLYFLGITILRQRLVVRRRIRLVFSRVKGNLHAAIGRSRLYLKTKAQELWRRMRAPFTRIRRTYWEELPSIRRARLENRIPFSSYREIAKQVGKMFLRVFATIFNYVAPVVAAMLLIVTVRNYTSRPLALKVVYQGDELGYVKDESVFSTAMQDVYSRVLATDSQSSSAQTESLAVLPTYELVELPQGATLSDTEDLADGIIMASNSQIEPAFGVYIDGQLLGAVQDKDMVIDEFNGMLEANLTGRPNEKRPDFLKSVSIKSGLYPHSSLRETEDILNIIHSNENIDQIYTVQEGDTPSGIAQKVGISFSRLAALNPELEGGSLLPGTELYTEKSTPFLEVKNIFTDVYLEEVGFETEEIENSLYAKSFRKVQDAGANGLEQISAEVVYVNGVEIERKVTSRQTVIAPKTEKVIIGVEKPPVVATQQSRSPAGALSSAPANPNHEGFIWPTSGGYISCPIGGYYGHTGTDIAGNGGVGSPLYAAASGRVTKAVNAYYGYGKHIVINHDNGYQTLYAHCDSLYVTVGDYVTQGQQIGTTGRTGRVTGPHLHFEIIYNGRYLDARDFIGYSP